MPRPPPPRPIAKASSAIIFPGQYGNAVRVVAFNTAEGWSWDVSEDIVREILRRAMETGEIRRGYFIDSLEPVICAGFT